MDEKEIYNFIIKIQAISKIGLKYSKDPYALTNYNEINNLSLNFLEKFMEVKFDRPNYFKRDVYPTPNISVRTVIFNENKDQVLMVREANTHTYSLPGGWADLYDSAAQTAKNECLQEAGAEIEIVRLVGLLARTPIKDPCYVPEYIAVFEGKLKKLNSEHEYETDEVKYFPIDNLPLNCIKCRQEELIRMITAAKKGETIFD